MLLNCNYIKPLFKGDDRKTLNNYIDLHPTFSQLFQNF